MKTRTVYLTTLGLSARKRHKRRITYTNRRVRNLGQKSRERTGKR